MALKPFISPLIRVTSPDVVTRTTTGNVPRHPVPGPGLYGWSVERSNGWQPLTFRSPFRGVTSNNLSTNEGRGGNTVYLAEDERRC